MENSTKKELRWYVKLIGKLRIDFSWGNNNFFIIEKCYEKVCVQLCIGKFHWVKMI